MITVPKDFRGGIRIAGANKSCRKCFGRGYVGQMIHINPETARKFGNNGMIIACNCIQKEEKK